MLPSTLHGHGIRSNDTASELKLGFNTKIPPSTGAFTAAQNRDILVAGLACACLSLVAAFIVLRWFLLLRRSFRHRLVLFLIASDTFKAIWYFVFAVVAFANGPVQSSSGFCQTSGYLLLLSVEASDFAILMIALHSMLYIFMPISKTGEGGLYPYRNWIYAFWLGPPLLSSSLAFVQGPQAYVTSGTYCSLPKRPIWYRLALSWIPRYLIITTILVMYASIYIYVHVKFHSFKNLAKYDSTYGSGSHSPRSTGPETIAQQSENEKFPELTEPPTAPSLLSIPLSPPKAQFARPSAPRMHSYNSLLGLGMKEKAPEDAAPWDAMSFITAKPLQDRYSNGVASADFAARHQAAGSADSGETYVSPPLRLERAHSVPTNAHQDLRKPSEVPTISTMNTSCTSDTATTATTHVSILTNPVPTDSKTVDPLRNTRVAIRKQLRFLFIYPLIYLMMWAFPFASHILNYSNHYVKHPPFWLAVVQTCSLALQAGVDSLVFSLREKPWRQVDENSKLSMPFLGRKLSEAMSSRHSESMERSAHVSFERQPERSEGQRSNHWWEAEGRTRKDSIWMGTDLLSRMTSVRSKDKDGEASERASQRSARKDPSEV